MVVCRNLDNPRVVHLRSSNNRLPPQGRKRLGGVQGRGLPMVYRGPRHPWADSTCHVDRLSDSRRLGTPTRPGMKTCGARMGRERTFVPSVPFYFVDNRVPKTSHPSRLTAKPRRIAPAHIFEPKFDRGFCI